MRRLSLTQHYVSMLGLGLFWGVMGGFFHVVLAYFFERVNVPNVTKLLREYCSTERYIETWTHSGRLYANIRL